MLMQFVQDNWLLCLGALIVVILVISLVKQVVKWVVVGVLIVGIAAYGFNYKPAQDLVQSVKTDAQQTVKDQAIKQLVSASDVKYTVGKDGVFVVSTTGIKLTGKVGDNNATLYIVEQKVPIKMDATLKAFVAKVKSQQ